MHYQRLPDWKKIPQLRPLLDLSNPPKQLYYQGSWHPELFGRCAAVIGSRRMTEYGRRVIEKLIPKLVFEKKTIVSGFMYGVDQYAHEICVASGGKTIAVLGWGIKRVLDGADRKLADAIVLAGGLLISEWEDQQATLWTFPVRNRIVAAISGDVIVVEAAGDAPPMVAKSTDPLLTMLEGDGLTVNEIARTLGQPVANIGAQLSLLTLSGQITERGGKYYVDKN